MEGGSWCQVCDRLRKRPSLNQVEALAQKHGGLLLSDKLVKHDQKLRWQCSEGHSWLARVATVRAGNWCVQCYHEHMREPSRICTRSPLRRVASAFRSCTSALIPTSSGNVRTGTLGRQNRQRLHEVGALRVVLNENALASKRCARSLPSMVANAFPIPTRTTAAD